MTLDQTPAGQDQVQPSRGQDHQQVRDQEAGPRVHHDQDPGLVQQDPEAQDHQRVGQDPDPDQDLQRTTLTPRARVRRRDE